MNDAGGRSESGLTLRALLARGHLRLVALAVVLAAASLTISGIFLIRGYTAANVTLAARTISYTVEPAILFADRDAIEEAIGSVGSAGSIDRIEVADANGEVLAVWTREEDGLGGAIEAALSGLFRDGHNTVPITHDGSVIGTVAVQGSARDILSYAVTGLVIGLCCLGLTIIATRVLARRLEEEIVAPLDHVGEIAHAVRTDRAFGRRVMVSGIAEIDRLARDFNALLAELQSWHDGLVSQNMELAKRAEHDALTGLGGRRRFERVIAQAAEKANEQDRPFAVLYLDCDGFKQINDGFGHDVGDMVLCAVAARLQDAVQDHGPVFRLGGDEFAVVLDRAADIDAIERVRDDLRDAMSAPFTLALRREQQLGMSIGHAIYPDDGKTWRELLRVADQRMYREKRSIRSDAVDEG